MQKPTTIKITSIHVTLSPSRTQSMFVSCYKFITAVPLHSQEGKSTSSLPVRPQGSCNLEQGAAQNAQARPGQGWPLKSSQPPPGPGLLKAAMWENPGCGCFLPQHMTSSRRHALMHSVFLFLMTHSVCLWSQIWRHKSTDVWLKARKFYVEKSIRCLGLSSHRWSTEKAWDPQRHALP